MTREQIFLGSREPYNVSLGLYDTSWTLLDVYFLTELMRSPLRTSELRDADVVVVPASSRMVRGEHKPPRAVEAARRTRQGWDEFFESNRPALAETLASGKPHVVIYDAWDDIGAAPGALEALQLEVRGAAALYSRLQLALIDCTVERQYNVSLVFISFAVNPHNPRYGDVVIAPYLHFHHWNAAATRRERARPAAEAAAAKHRLVTQSFEIRPLMNHEAGAGGSLSPWVRKFSRVQAYEACESRPNSTCEHFDWRETSHPAPAHYVAKLHELNVGSWFNNQARGDLFTRNSYTDALLAGSVPIFPQCNAAQWMPFNDFIDWDDISEVIDDGQFERTRCTCRSSDSNDGDAAAPDEEGAEEFGPQHQQQHEQHRQQHQEQRQRQHEDPPPPCACDGPTFIDVLEQRYPGGGRGAERKLAALWPLRQVFQYSSEPDHGLVRWDRRGELDEADDALTFTFKALMRALCRKGLAAPGRCVPAPGLGPDERTAAARSGDRGRSGGSSGSGSAECSGESAADAAVAVERRRHSRMS